MRQLRVCIPHQRQALQVDLTFDKSGELITFMVLKKKEPRHVREFLVRDGIFFFKLMALHGLYTDCLKALGVHEAVNLCVSNGLILEYFPGAQKQRQRNYIVIAFKEGMQDILKQAMDDNIEDGVATPAKAATIVGEDIFGAERFALDSSFPRYCQRYDTIRYSRFTCAQKLTRWPA